MESPCWNISYKTNTQIGSLEKFDIMKYIETHEQFHHQKPYGVVFAHIVLAHWKRILTISTGKSTT